MFSWFKRKNKNSEKSIPQKSEYKFKWYELGEGNPFNKKILDIRSYTGTVLAFTSDQKVAEKYNDLRSSLGEYLVEEIIPESLKSPFELSYPHNGDQLSGVVFKADVMDCKWDIYAYNDVFYFARSWDGQLIYKAYFKTLPNAIQIESIEHEKSVIAEVAASDIHYLIKTHALNQPVPHYVPNRLNSDMEIASWSFVKFGNRGYYATHEYVFDVIVDSKEK